MVCNSSAVCLVPLVRRLPTGRTSPDCLFAAYVFPSKVNSSLSVPLISISLRTLLITIRSVSDFGVSMMPFSARVLSFATLILLNLKILFPMGRL